LLLFEPTAQIVALTIPISQGFVPALLVAIAGCAFGASLLPAAAMFAALILIRQSPEGWEITHSALLNAGSVSSGCL